MASKLELKLAEQRRLENLARARKKQEALRRAHEKLKVHQALETHHLLRGKEPIYSPSIATHTRIPGMFWGIIIVLILFILLYLISVR